MITYVDDSDVNMAVFQIIEGVIAPITGQLPNDKVEEMADSIKSILGRFTGIRTEDGKSRVYEINLVEGEPYVYDE